MPKGGLRPGAGRKRNLGIYGEQTFVKRVPVSLESHIDQMISKQKRQQNGCLFEVEGRTVALMGRLKGSPLKLPLFASRIPAGFPSPADDYLESSLDLNAHLIDHPAATFFIRVSGDSMIQAGIHHNDILVVDRSLTPKSGDIVIAALDGEFTVKRLLLEGKTITLKPENPGYQPLIITEGREFMVWGVVTSAIHQFKGML